jgi:hypothetical protein
MSFAKLSYDTCAYNTYLEESINVGKYMLNTPSVACKDNCFFTSPYVRLDKFGVAQCDNKELIDVDSELLGLNMKNTKCPKERTFDSSYCKNGKLDDCTDTFMSPEDTKLSNPPCTLRGTGWNRWEWLCENPQDTAIMPFEREIQNRIVVKDNHRPCIPILKSSDDVMPSHYKNTDCYTDAEIKSMYDEKETIPFIHWRSCDEIRKL